MMPDASGANLGLDDDLEDSDFNIKKEKSQRKKEKKERMERKKTRRVKNDDEEGDEDRPTRRIPRA